MKNGETKWGNDNVLMWVDNFVLVLGVGL